MKRRLLDIVMTVFYSPSIFLAQYLDYHQGWAYQYLILLVIPPLFLASSRSLVLANVSAIAVSFVLSFTYFGPETYPYFKPVTPAILSILTPLGFLPIQLVIFHCLRIFKKTLK